MRIEVVVALIALSGVIVGSLVTFIGNYIQKRVERNSQIHKLITEKRFEAYENIIASVKWCVIMVGQVKENYFVKYPQIFMSSNNFNSWVVNFNLVVNNSSHLLHKELDEKLHIFETYIVNLSNLLQEVTDENGDFIDDELAHNIGEILYDDFRLLTTDIIKEASKFYFSGIYSLKFKPPTIYHNINQTGEKELEKIKKMALFTRRSEIRQMITNTVEAKIHQAIKD